MNLLIPIEPARRIHAALRGSGRKEVGGLLMGEHVSEDTFRVADVTVQTHGGTPFGFVRCPEAHAAQLASFFEKTERKYTQFNYLGEWHSHPNVPASPSASDIAEMVRLVEDSEVDVSFAVLLIVRLAWLRRLVGTATEFTRSRNPRAANLVWERVGQ